MRWYVAVAFIESGFVAALQVPEAKLAVLRVQLYMMFESNREERNDTGATR